MFRYIVYAGLDYFSMYIQTQKCMLSFIAFKYVFILAYNSQTAYCSLFCIKMCTYIYVSTKRCFWFKIQNFIRPIKKRKLSSRILIICVSFSLFYLSFIRTYMQAASIFFLTVKFLLQTYCSEFRSLHWTRACDGWTKTFVIQTLIMVLLLIVFYEKHKLYTYHLWT